MGQGFESLRTGQRLNKETTMISEEENAAIAAKREQQRLSDAAVAEFLARGGVVQQIPAGRSGAVAGGNMWGRGRKKAAAPVEDADIADIAEPTTLAEDAESATAAVDAEELLGEPVFPEDPEDFALDDE